MVQYRKGENDNHVWYKTEK